MIWKADKRTHTNSSRLQVVWVAILLIVTSAMSIAGSWEDLAGIGNSQYDGTFYIRVIDRGNNLKELCDCNNGTPKYKLNKSHVITVRGIKAFKWLENKGLAYYVEKNGKKYWYKKKDRFNDWLFLRKNNQLYWQKCSQYCVNQTQGNQYNDECDVKPGQPNDHRFCPRFVWCWRDIKSGDHGQCKKPNRPAWVNCVEVCNCITSCKNLRVNKD